MVYPKPYSTYGTIAFRGPGTCRVYMGVPVQLLPGLRIYFIRMRGPFGEFPRVVAQRTWGRSVPRFRVQAGTWVCDTHIFRKHMKAAQ